MRNKLGSVLSSANGIKVARVLSDESGEPYRTVEWETRDSVLGDRKRLNVRFPSTWSINAGNIVAHKYFYGGEDDPKAESSLSELIDRVVNRIGEWAIQFGYLDDKQNAKFLDELRMILLHQRASFNSPVWFNLGVPDREQQCSACFILKVEDKMESILNWIGEEGTIFKRGSGAGVNLSAIRSSAEELTGGNQASGPVPFMRGADSSAGVIKSGSTTRKAAKMVILDVDHPDIEEFIWCKKHEEDKARALAEAGFDMSFDGKDMHSVQYQNANNSVRVTDEFMQAAVNDEEWGLISRTTGEVVRTVPARELLRQIAESAWHCADPGIQYDTTINRWHTLPAIDRINGSNPCSEYMSIDNSACNLASLNLRTFVDQDGHFDEETFRHVVSVMTLAMDILVAGSSYPTKQIGENAKKYRQLGLGYANLGGMLMALGLPYDSDEGRCLAAQITSLMSAQAYATSGEVAAAMGPFADWDDCSDAMDHVLRMHRKASDELWKDTPEKVDGSLAQLATEVWDQAIEACGEGGIRNSQVSVLAPTGTIGLMMDCDTLGVEPDMGLLKNKKLVGGGTMTILSTAVIAGLERLGYDRDVADYVEEHGTVIGAPGLREEHLAVFDCSMGERVVSPMGHVKMMEAVQPFISGAISKTVNMPESSTVEDIEQVYVEGWKRGLKALAVYRDNCKVAQPTSVGKPVAKAALSYESAPVARHKLPQERVSTTRSFRIGGSKGYLTVGRYEDGKPGEIFIKLGKQGSTLSGVMDAFAIVTSIGLQYGVPLEAYTEKLTGMQFAPSGMTDDADIRMSSSIIDYVFKRLAVSYMDDQARREIGIMTTQERIAALEVTEPAPFAVEVAAPNQDAPICEQCGTTTRRSGACYVCETCGTSTGCS